MRPFLKRAAYTAAAACVAVPAIASFVQYTDAGGHSIDTVVMMWLSGGNAVPASTANPLPVPTPATTYQGTITLVAGTIDVTKSQLLADLQAAVTAGALTQARMTQALNLAVSSP
jgi:hypothetical protein